MLRAAALLLQLTLWVAAVHAFFPFIPNDDCDPNGHCGPLGSASRRRDDGAARTPEGVALDLVHRPRVPHDDSTTAPDPITQALERLARKFGGLRPSPVHGARPGLGKRKNAFSISEPAAPTASNSAGVYQYGPDYSYFIKVQVGSAQQPFYMLLDTGAANSWLMGSACQSAACKIHNSLDPTSSKSWQTGNKPFAISYGSGDLTGVVGQDTVSLAGLTFDLPFGLANYTHDDFTHFAFDGILGLAMSSSVTGTFLQILQSKKLLSSVVFGVSLSRDSDGRNDGEVTFGGVDPAKYTGQISYTNIQSPEKENGEWAIPLGGVSFDGTSAAITSKLAYIDTGTSFIFAPPEDLAALFKLVPGASTHQNGGYVEYKVPCNTTLPIKVTFSGVSYEISAQDWVAGSGDNCFSRIYGYTIQAGTWLLGDTFLKNVYAVFDADKLRIGFASKPSSSPPKSMSAAAGGAPAATTTTGAGALATVHPIMPGFSGQDTPSPATAETTTSPKPVPTQVSHGDGLGRSTFVSVVCAVAAVVMAV